MCVITADAWWLDDDSFQSCDVLVSDCVACIVYEQQVHSSLNNNFLKTILIKSQEIYITITIIVVPVELQRVETFR